MAKKKSKPRGINGKPWFWWVTRYECGPMPTARKRGRWYMYRCFDAANVLVYVGSTNDLSARFYTHRRMSLWHKLVVRTEIVEFADRVSVLYAESQTILREMPAYNNRRQSPLTQGWDEATIEESYAQARPQGRDET